MKLVRHTPQTALHPFFADFDRFFGDNWPAWPSAPGQSTERTWKPAVDIIEEDDKFVLVADLPDVNQDDIKVEVHDGTLTLQAERKLESEENKDNYRRIERSYGSFTRSFSLPDTVNVDDIGAKYDKGVLRLTLPKQEVEDKARVINVG